MGGREVGGMANLLSGHRDLANPEHRAEVAALWGCGGAGEAGPHRRRTVRGGARGEIKALWIACTNPAQSLPDRQSVHAALAACPFVVVQEASAHTDTAAFADLLLPAAGWGEKEGTVTNSERRISRVRAAVPAPGEARADWRIAVDFARRWAPGSALAGRPTQPCSPTPRPRTFSTSTAPPPRPRPRHRRPLLRPAGTRRPAAMAAIPPAPRAAPRGSTPTACFPPPAAAPASSCSTARPPKPPMRACRSASTPAGCATSGTA
jgi:assimilatory nitrate reductase catalytic subunit